MCPRSRARRRSFVPVVADAVGIGRLEEAETEALEAAAAQPRNSGILDTVVSVLLSRAEPRGAAFIQTQRAREPDVQSWLAHEAVAAG